MGALAVILARAGSKGVPGKNVAPVAGRPCIAWTIDDAKQSRTSAADGTRTEARALPELIDDAFAPLAEAQMRGIDRGAARAVPGADEDGPTLSKVFQTGVDYLVEGAADERPPAP